MAKLPSKFILYGDTQREELVKTCLVCGAIFEKDGRYSWAYFSKQRFCSARCSGVHNSKTMKRVTKSEKFWRHVDERDFSKCWPWQGPRDSAGYGQANWQGRILRAHALSLDLSGRPVPKGMHSCHTCDNKSCVNPAHLYVGTPAQNSRDAVLAGSHAKKLCKSDVIEIRASSLGAKSLSELYGVSETMIYQIKSRKKWKHI